MSIVGVDIGSSTTVIAIVRSGGVDVICNEVSDRATPTMIGFDTKRRLLGDAARTQHTGNFRNTATQLIRLLGKYDERIMEQEVSFQTCEMIEKDDMLAIRVNYLAEERIFSSVELMGMFLGKVKNIVQAENKGQAADYVIAIPQFFTDIQRKQMLAAAEIAGINCLKIISDTTASALCYGLSKNDQLTDKPKQVAIVDFGYSSLKACIASFTKAGLEIKATAFDEFLGGRDFDMEMTRHFLRQIKDKSGYDLSTNKRVVLRVRTACERMKKVLSGVNYTRVDLEALVDGRDFTLEMTRSELDGLLAPLFTRAVKCLQKLIESPGMELDKLDSVEIVGGIARIPAFKELLYSIFKKEVSTTLNQDEAIARGAALQCAVESPTVRVKPFNIKDFNVFGVKTLDKNGLEQLVIPHGFNLPGSNSFSINNSSLPVEYTLVYEEPIPFSSSPNIAHYVISGSKALPTKSLIKVEASIDKNGISSISKASLFEDKVEAATPTPTPTTTIESSTEGNSAPPPKRVTREYQLNITVSETNDLSSTVIQSLRDQECLMAASDKHAFELDDCRNAVEEYIYEMRGKLEGSLSKFMTENDSRNFLKLLNESENWLYDQTDINSKEVFNKKLAELKAIGQPAMERMKEHDDRPYAENVFRQTVSSLVEKAKTFSPEDNELVMKECETKVAWLDSQLRSVSNQPLYEKPKLLVSQINQEQKNLQAFGAKIAADIIKKAQERAKAEAAKRAAAAQANKAETSTTNTTTSSNQDSENNTIPSEEASCNPNVGNKCHDCHCGNNTIPSMELD